MMTQAQQVKKSLQRLDKTMQAIGRDVQYMEVCGTHTMSAFRTGLHGILPDRVTLLSGPGCPVCVTAQGDIDLMIDLAVNHDAVICTYGDMLRVPGRLGSLEQARSRGADVKIIYSAADAVRLAQQHANREVVFASVGFETTAPGAAVAILSAARLGLKNLTLLASHKRIMPAMHALLQSGKINVDGFLCPGHVSVIVGAAVYRPIAEQYGLPCVVTGFEGVQMAEALAQLAQMTRDGRAEVVNLYPEAVSDAGNRIAQTVLDEVFEPVTARWRGLGEMAQSGMDLRTKYRPFDARIRFNLAAPKDCEPAGCLCGQVITGMVKPAECSLFATVCTPTQPIGPCMVSSEGTCQAWFKYRRGQAAGRDQSASAQPVTEAVT